MSAPSSDDLLPAPRSPGRLARRRSQQLRRWWIVGGAVGAVALIVLVSVVVFGSDNGSDGGSGDGARRAGHGSTDRSTTTTTRRRTSTTSAAPDDPTASTSTTSSAVESVPGGGGTTTPTDGPDTDPAAGLSVTEDPGACRWLADTEEMVDSGMLYNSGTEDAVAEVEVIWSDATGELDSYTTVEEVPAGGSTPWSVSDNFIDTPPQGLTCQIALI